MFSYITDPNLLNSSGVFWDISELIMHVQIHNV